MYVALAVNMFGKLLPSLIFMGIFLPFLPHAYPSSEGSAELEHLFKRDGTTAQSGDYTGSTSSYPDGSGTYVDSKDQGTYASGVKCWTDIVGSRSLPSPATQNIMKMYPTTNDRHSSTSQTNTKPKPGHR